MPSPFPGMDPYLENPTVWPGFHTSFIVAMMTELNRTLPKGYMAEIDEYLWIEEPDGGRVLPGKTDLVVPENGTGQVEFSRLPSTTTAPTAEVRLRKSPQKRRRFLKIITLADRRAVTVLELLSPANKRRGKDRNAYLAKRNEYLATVNLVELDLLRAGERMPMGGASPATPDYFAFICATHEEPNARIWAFGVRDPLPVIPIPLAELEDDHPLALQNSLHWVYDASRYTDKIDYTQPPMPPLRPADAEWAADLLAKRGGQ